MKVAFSLLLVVLLVKPTEGFFFGLLCRILSPIFPFLFPNGCVPCSIADGSAQCCSVSDCADPAADVCESRYCLGKGNPRFTLTWTGDDDLDIHVITPGGFEISYLNIFDADSGGTLDLDSYPEAGESGKFVENIFFPLDGSAPRGNYTYFVVNTNQVDTPDTYSFEVFTGDTLAATQTGSVAFEQEGTKYTFVL